MITPTLLETATKKNYYIADATDNAAGNLKFDSTTGQHYICPTGKRWFLYGGVVYRDANETLNILIRDSSDRVVSYLCDEAAGTGYKHYPTSLIGYFTRPQVLDAGEYVDITFGGAQGAGAKATCCVLEVDV